MLDPFPSELPVGKRRQKCELVWRGEGLSTSAPEEAVLSLLGYVYEKNLPPILNGSQCVSMDFVLNRQLTYLIDFHDTWGTRSSPSP